MLSSSGSGSSARAFLSASRLCSSPRSGTSSAEFSERGRSVSGLLFPDSLSTIGVMGPISGSAVSRLCYFLLCCFLLPFPALSQPVRLSSVPPWAGPLQAPASQARRFSAHNGIGREAACIEQNLTVAFRSFVRKLRYNGWCTVVVVWMTSARSEYCVS